MESSKKKGSKNQVRIIEVQEKALKKEIEDSLLEQVISFGIESYIEVIEKEITGICGERYRHISGREFSRWSTIATPVIFGGRKVLIPHRRVRNIKINQEKDLQSISKYRDREILSRRQMEQMIIGVSTRKYRRSLETDTNNVTAYSDSKSTVSRNFIAKTQEKLEAWRNEPIKENYPILMIDGIVYKKTTVIVVLGIDKYGQKEGIGSLGRLNRE